MLAYADNEFYLSKTEEGFEANNREIFKQLEKSLGEPNAKLEISRKPPQPFLYVWQWFVELQGAQPLTFQEIKAWSELKGIRLTNFELSLLTKLTKQYHGG